MGEGDSVYFDGLQYGRTGITRMGLRVHHDKPHSFERTTVEAAQISTRSIAITHANPAAWHPVLGNKSDGFARTMGGNWLDFYLVSPSEEKTRFE